jgi:hypothetical protein
MHTFIDEKIENNMVTLFKITWLLDSIRCEVESTIRRNNMCH